MEIWSFSKHIVIKATKFNSFRKNGFKRTHFTGEFLGIAIAEENFFQDLGKGKVLELLKYLSKFQLPMLSKEAYRQIVKNAEELYPLLREIIPRLHKGIRSCF